MIPPILNFLCSCAAIGYSSHQLLSGDLSLFGCLLLIPALILGSVSVFLHSIYFSGIMRKLEQGKVEKILVISKRSHDTHICFKGKPGMWGCGKSTYEAIGDLVSHHQKELGIKLEFDNERAD